MLPPLRWCFKKWHVKEFPLSTPLYGEGTSHFLNNFWQHFHLRPICWQWENENNVIIPNTGIGCLVLLARWTLRNKQKYNQKNCQLWPIKFTESSFLVMNAISKMYTRKIVRKLYLRLFLCGQTRNGTPAVRLGRKPSTTRLFCRRKFRSQISDNMDRLKRRGGKSQQREEKKREDQTRERVRRKKAQAREKVRKSRTTVFFQVER